MKDDKKTSIIKDALTDYNAIKEAAEANAKQKLAEEFPEKFNRLLKEELQDKNKKGYKKIEEPEKDKEDTVMKKDEKETKKVVDENAGEGKPFTEKSKAVGKVEETAGDGKPFSEKAKATPKVEEDVKITDTVGKGDPFKEKAKKSAQKIDEEREKDFTGDVEAKTPNIGKGEGEKKAFTEKPKNPTSGKPIANLKEEFDVTGLDAAGAGGAIEGAGEDDEILTMEEIEREIANMETLGEELDMPSSGGAYNELVEMRNKLDQVIKEMHQGNFPIDKMHAGDYDNKLIYELSVDEMHSAGSETFGSDSQISALHNQGPTDKLIDEQPITDKDVEDVLGAPAGEVEESQTRTLANQKKVTAALPGKDYKETAIPKMRLAMQEQLTQMSKKMGALIEENKKLTKKLNETKKYKESVGTLVEGYKTALEKYRNQLKEMATFNTNLAHVNNLLVNEELALTQDDKIKIINEFKKVDSIASSQKVYKNFLTEMKGSKKTLTESVERKVAASVQPSSKQKLDEVVEKTAYADDKHVQRMKKLIETIENRGKKIIK